MTRIAPILFVVLWASGFVGAQAGMPYAEPGTFLSLRFAFAFVALAILSWLVKANPLSRQQVLFSILVGMLVHGVYLTGIFWAVRHGMPSAVAAVVVGLQPLLTAVLAAWFLKEPMTRRHGFGLVLGFVGVVLVLAPKLDVTGSGINSATVAVVLISCVAIACGTVLQRAVGGNTDLRSGTAAQYLGGLIPPAILMLFETRVVIWNGELVFAFVWLVFVLSISAVMLLMWLINRGSVTQVGALFFLVPGVAAAMSWLIYGDALSSIQLLGMVTTAVAIWLVQRKA